MDLWLKTPAGAYAAAWVQAELDRAVADAFGYHALQMGLPQLDGLRSNRMPHRWLLDDSAEALARPNIAADDAPAAARPALALRSEFHSLPFPSASIDLRCIGIVLSAPFR